MQAAGYTCTMPACRLCLLATGLLLGLLLFTPLSATGLSEGKLSRTATGTTTLSAGLARTSPLSRGQVSTKPPVVTKEGGNGEKQGTCPSVDFPKLGLCEDQCQMDSQCSGNMKCCRNGCGKMGCTTPKF